VCYKLSHPHFLQLFFMLDSLFASKSQNFCICDTQIALPQTLPSHNSDMGLIGYSKYYLITNLKNCKKYVDLLKIVWGAVGEIRGEKRRAARIHRCTKKNNCLSKNRFLKIAHTLRNKIVTQDG
jgi:hypothetical protein